MNKRLLNFAEYLKEELKIDLSDKKLKSNLKHPDYNKKRKIINKLKIKTNQMVYFLQTLRF